MNDLGDDAEMMVSHDNGQVWLKIAARGRYFELELTPQAAADVATALIEHAYQVVMASGGGSLQVMLPAVPDGIERIEVPARKQ